MKRLTEEQKLIKQHMQSGEPGWQSTLAGQLGKSVNAVYCAAYRLMDSHGQHKEWTWAEKCKVVELREKGKTFAYIGQQFGVSAESARKTYYWMTPDSKGGERC